MADGCSPLSSPQWPSPHHLQDVNCPVGAECGSLGPSCVLKAAVAPSLGAPALTTCLAFPEESGPRPPHCRQAQQQGAEAAGGADEEGAAAGPAAAGGDAELVLGAEVPPTPSRRTGTGPAGAPPGPCTVPPWASRARPPPSHWAASVLAGGGLSAQCHHGGPVTAPFHASPDLCCPL